ncbi:MAG: YihY/virulence factor BrkB family protein [Marinilabiliales bacterium]|nr:MAG: YihY/virulence factor BrkB family protein [Marinilabiliales bacterium]
MVDKEKINRVIRFFKRDIWRMPIDELPPLRAFLLKQLKILIIALRGFSEDKIQLRASALTYYTLLSLVPVVAMAFGIAKGFGLDQYLEEELSKVFAGREEVFEWVLSFSQSLLETTRGGLMAGVGLIILFWTIMKVLSHIEHSFNEIWQINQPRSFTRKFADYFSMMLIAPLFIILANGFTVFITTQISNITQSFVLLGFLSPIIMFFVQLIPYLLLWTLFTILYMIMPNTKVNFASALLAGIIAGTLFQLVQWSYIHFQVGVSRYNAIYGSFAALPLLLLVMQVSWLVVLFGAEISFANQNVEQYEFEAESLNMSSYNRRLLTLYIAHLLVKNFENGVPPYTARQISNELEIPIRLVRELLYELVDINVISEAKTKFVKETAYQPAIDINRITIKFISDKLDHRGMDVLIARKSEEIEKLKGIMDAFNNTLEKCQENKLLKEV